MSEWILWIDLETSGLDPLKDKILQIACIISNYDLSIQYFIPELNINCDNKTLEQMSNWCIQTHGKSGVLLKSLSSTVGIYDGESSILAFINQHLGIRDTVVLAGNSVHFDKEFIRHHMPRLHDRLHHRILDVSSLALVCKNANPNVYNLRPQKQYGHTAMNDIFESIVEYQYYLGNFIKN